MHVSQSREGREPSEVCDRAMGREVREDDWWRPGTRGSSALRNPPPKSGCARQHRTAGLGQTLPTGSPIAGSRVYLYRAILVNFLHSSGAECHRARLRRVSPGGAAMSTLPRGRANTAPLRRPFTTPCFYGVGGLLKNTTDSP